TGTVTCTATRSARAQRSSVTVRRSCPVGRAARPPLRTLVMTLAGRLAGGTDLSAWMADALDALTLRGGPPRLEWWPADEAVAPLATSGPELAGARSELRLGPAGRVVAVGGPIPAELEWALQQLGPFVRWRLGEDRLVQHIAAVAGRNAALDDFADL